MSRVSKKMIITTMLILTLLTIGLYGVSQVSAEDLASHAPIVQRIADKFGLNVADVEEVFTQERQEHHQLMRQNFEERLNQAVSDGKLTEDQKNALLEKIDEVKAEREAYRLQNREEMQAWFSQQGIDPEVLGKYLGGFAKGFGRGGHHGLMIGTGQ